MAAQSKIKRNQHALQQQQLQQHLAHHAHPANAERYNLLSSSVDERAPAPSHVPKPLSVVFVTNFISFTSKFLAYFMYISVI